MPRYYFRLTDGEQVVKTPEGLDLPGNAAAREEAVKLARELKHDKTLQGRKWDDWFVAVVDQHGKQVETVPIAAVPDESPLSPI
jgi:hypothetical protein